LREEKKELGARKMLKAPHLLRRAAIVNPSYYQELQLVISAGQIF